MSEVNPYEKFLDGRPVETILASTANAIAENLKVIGADKVNVPPAPGKWSAAEIVCHSGRLRNGLWFPAAPDPRRGWADDPALRPGQVGAMYPGVPAAQALGIFSDLRQWNLRLIRRGAAGGGGQDGHPSRTGQR